MQFVANEAHYDAFIVSREYVWTVRASLKFVVLAVAVLFAVCVGAGLGVYLQFIVHVLT